MRTTLLTILGLFLAAYVYGLTLPRSTVVEKSSETRADPARLYELVGDLARWPEWSPAFRETDEFDVDVRPGERTTGVGANCKVLFGRRSESGTKFEFAALFLVAEDDPKHGVTLEVRLGTPDTDLIGGEGTRAWESIRWEPAADGGTKVTWKRTGEDMDQPLLRLVDRFAMASRVEEQVVAGLDALVEAAESPSKPAGRSDDLAPAPIGAAVHDGE
ncbi:MAG: SRPBCC family protein [Planctomycetota bacterium]